MAWLVAVNMPGYVPHQEPLPCDDWSEAREALRKELEETWETLCPNAALNEEQPLNDALRECHDLPHDLPATIILCGWAHSLMPLTP